LYDKQGDDIYHSEGVATVLAVERDWQELTDKTDRVEELWSTCLGAVRSTHFNVFWPGRLIAAMIEIWQRFT